jgi:hypothetical protein
MQMLTGEATYSPKGESIVATLIETESLELTVSRPVGLATSRYDPADAQPVFGATRIS